MSHASRPPTLVIRFREDPAWIGGSIYIEQILHLLTLLPALERPRVKIRLASPINTPFAQRLARHPVLQHPRDFSSTKSIPARFEKNRRLVAKHLNQLGALLNHDEVIFPVFEATKPWENNLYWIPDFQHHHLPHLFSPEEIENKNRNIAAIARSTGTLLLSSQTALADFQRFYPSATVNTVVWRFTSTLKADPNQDPRQQLSAYNLPEKFIYVANQFWKHKDHATLFEALGRLRQGGMIIPVVCTGHTEDPRDPDYFLSIKSLLKAQRIETQTIILGIIPRDIQCALFRVAAIIVQPSNFEGWSTVLEDAKALGRPIIASDIPTHQEQLVETAQTRLFHARDVTDLAETLAATWVSAQQGPDMNQETSSRCITVRRMDAAARELSAMLRRASLNFQYQPDRKPLSSANF